MENKKFLDANGIKILWNQVNLKDYPNNEMLIAVINAIDANKQDKTTTKNITLLQNNWSLGLDNRYYQTVSVDIVDVDTPAVLVDCILTGNNLNVDLKVLNAWQLISINNVVQGNKQLTFYSYSQPEIDVPVIIGVV